MMVSRKIGLFTKFALIGLMLVVGSSQSMLYAKIWGTNNATGANDTAYFLPNVTSAPWIGVTSSTNHLLKQISVSNGLAIGVNAAGEIWYRTDVNPTSIVNSASRGSWTRLDGGLKCVAVNNNGVIWGVNSNNNIFFRASLTTPWIGVAGSLIQVSVGNNLVIGVNTANEIWCRTDVNPANPADNRWTRLEGALKWVSVSNNGVIWGVNAQNQIFVRTGVSATVPQGTGWQVVAGALTQVAVSNNLVIGVNAANEIYYRTDVNPANPADNRWTRLGGILTNIAVSDN